MTEHLFIFVVSFTLIFLVMLVLYFIKRKKGELKTSNEMRILVARFKLDSKKINYNALGLFFVLINSLIVSVTGTIATANDMHYAWQLAVAFVLLMAFMISSYSLVGIYLKRKENKK